MRCVRCGGEQFSKAGRDGEQRQRFRCSTCQARQTARSASAFAGYRFPDEIIALAVRWYLYYRLPYADVAELLAERGVFVDASTVFDWVQRFAPLYQAVARPQRKRVRGKWSIDETYIKVAGVSCYVFRAIDDWGQVIDVYVSRTRDAEAATTFLRRAVEATGVRPHTAYPPALAVVLPGTQQVTGKLEQQEIERDHQHLKGRYRSMRGFKQLRCAQVVCAGHGFVRNLRNGCYRLGLALGDARLRRVPQAMRAWDELTTLVQAA